MPVTLKPGHKTSEFVVVLLTNIGLVLAASADWLPPRYAAIGSAIASAAFAISRGLSKVNPPKEVEPVGTTSAPK